ncbi:sodium-dependent nutrient amino acid transporter 1 [Diachasma alloeum]|uniref:sodium-dependent nutrient amino acid transporter 1 n=1 Tax=Diachasma alloeum TaxID=454923 RepID=UPI00073842C1|nr:sodium-dependent nutrient amino acid transporter 1 [Diachasma alloeum]
MTVKTIIGQDNEAFDPEPEGSISSSSETNGPQGKSKARGWNNSIEFLMSCVALSVGFGNVWRFPFTCYENGGGAFLIPYIILLILVGKPFYYMEMILGQFTGRSSTKVWSFCPVFTGVGWAQMASIAALATYYCSLMALTLYYLVASFSSQLPWAECREEWGDYCVNSGKTRDNVVEGVAMNTSHIIKNTALMRSSAELYFSKIVLKEKANIDDGIGLPDWKLALCLAGSWICVYGVLSRGIRSTGKASYFLAIFPYVVLIALVIRAVTLDGAVNGIIFFINPNWSKLLEPGVWYAAITQCFFSLSVCFGAIITFSSHNNFRHNIYRDVIIITSLDTVTSLIAGCTIFGILGNLAKEMGTDDISTVVRSGTGLAFISYPDAIAKFSFVPQIFSVLFFMMMFVLGVGSASGIAGSVIAAITGEFPNIKHWQVLYPTCFIGFLFGLLYVTPGGQFILVLVDRYGTSFVVFILASFEITGIMWFYGIENFLEDVEFMIKREPSVYWRLCWFIITPVTLIIIFIYTVSTLPPLTYGNATYPKYAHIAGAILLAFGISQIPIWGVAAMIKRRSTSPGKMIKSAFSSSREWGPLKPEDRQEWLLFKEEKLKMRNLRTSPRWRQIIDVIFSIKRDS